MIREEAIKDLIKYMRPATSEELEAEQTYIDSISIKFKEVVHGEWKYTVTGYPYCSNCNWMPEEDEILHTNYFCPNCGAKMDS